MSRGHQRAGDDNSPLRIPKMAELVSQRLRRQIVRGELSKDDALPSEATLMAQFGVSRPTLREALRVLESEGMIIVRRGAHGGARVQTPESDTAARYAGLVLQHRGASIEDVLEGRNIIEAQCAALLARRRTSADIKQLRAAVSGAQDAIDDPSQLLRLHDQFHTLMIELAGNQTMIVLNSMVRHIIDLSSYAHVSANAAPPANIRAIRKGFRAHEKLVEHIESRQADEAQELWMKHLVDAVSFTFGGSSPQAALDILG